MLYKTLLTLKRNDGLTEALKEKIDMFYLADRISEEEYRVLMDIPLVEETNGENPDVVEQ